MLKVKDWLSQKKKKRQYVIGRGLNRSAMRLYNRQVVEQGVLYNGLINGEERLFEFLSFRPDEVRVEIALFHTDWEDFKGTQICEMNDIKTIEYVKG